MCGRGHEWEGACVAGWGTCMAGRGHAWEGLYMASEWAGGMHAGEMADEADGTHPTGMHSFYCYVFRAPLR